MTETVQFRKEGEKSRHRRHPRVKELVILILWLFLSKKSPLTLFFHY